jgi:quercetin dioxygenase-like cupin family protein
MNEPERPSHRPMLEPFRWENVELRPYKEEGRAPFKSISRQALFADPELAGELRYFEIAPGGYSTLERHAHVHGVMILRGAGHCLVGREIRAVKAHDLIRIASRTWHQFRADAGECLGFLCLVDAERDRPQLPDAADLAELATDPAVAAFLAGIHSSAVNDS